MKGGFAQTIQKLKNINMTYLWQMYNFHPVDYSKWAGNN